MRKLINLPDNRKLSYIDVGDENGKVVIYFHGVPSAASDYEMWINEVALKKLKIRLISVDRPGIGNSTYKPNRTIANFAQDISFLTDFLNIDKFSVLGYSGGGPYAAVCAALIREKVLSLALVSSVVSFDKENLLKGLSRLNTNFLKLSRTVPFLFRLLYCQSLLISKIVPRKYFKTILKSLDKKDAELFLRPNVHNSFLISKGSSRGEQLDVKLVITPWNFNLHDIQVPTFIWQGGRDTCVSVGMSKYLEQSIKNSSMTYLKDEGHVSLIINKGEEILKKLLYNY